MKRPVAQPMALLAIIALAFLTTRTSGQETPKAKAQGARAENPAVKPDPAVIAQLIRDLASDDFATREKASKQLGELDDVPDTLQEATESADLEVARRAKAAINAITAVPRQLQKIDFDRLVHHMVIDQDTDDEKHWELIQAVARLVTKESNKMAGRDFEVPAFDVNTLKRVLLMEKTGDLLSANKSVVLSPGATPHIHNVVESLVIVDGDFAGANTIDKSILIVHGKVGSIQRVNKSIILASGSFQNATFCYDSFFQMGSHEIGKTIANNNVLLNAKLKAIQQANNRVLEADKGPLQLLKFSQPIPEEQIVRKQEVNNLAIDLLLAEQKDQFIIRWKNVGKGSFRIPSVRLAFDKVDTNHEDLLMHFFLKDSDGRCLPARRYDDAPSGRTAQPIFRPGRPAPQFGPGAPFRPGPILDPLQPQRRGPVVGSVPAIVLKPGQTYEQTFNLWTYVKRPEATGRYPLSFKLDISDLGEALKGKVKPWSGQIQSNAITVFFVAID